MESVDSFDRNRGRPPTNEPCLLPFAAAASASPPLPPCIDLVGGGEEASTRDDAPPTTNKQRQLRELSEQVKITRELSGSLIMSSNGNNNSVPDDVMDAELAMKKKLDLLHDTPRACQSVEVNVGGVKQVVISFHYRPENVSQPTNSNNKRGYWCRSYIGSSDHELFRYECVAPSNVRCRCLSV